MGYITKISEPEKCIDQILDATQKFDTHRFLYGLQYRNWNEVKLRIMLDDVTSSLNKLEKEYNRLVEFAKTFNLEFATDDNQRFDSALTLLRKIRSGISETKQIFMKFCPRAHKQRFYRAVGSKPLSVFDYSAINADAYQFDLFEFENYPHLVSELYQEMEKFFFLLSRCIQLCKQVLEDEKKIKKDHAYCKFLYEEFKEKVLKEIIDIIMMIPKDAKELTEEQNPAIASRNHFADDAAWASFGFHNFSKTETKCLVIKQVLEEEAESDLTRTEILLFGNDEKKVHQCRYIIQHFDDLIPETYHREKLPAKMIQMFFLYVGIKHGLEETAANYFNDMYNASPTHQHSTVSYAAINSYKRDVLIDKDGAYKAFVEALKNRFFATLPLPMAANF